jgi:hypothetical protein
VEIGEDIHRPSKASDLRRYSPDDPQFIFCSFAQTSHDPDAPRARQLQSRYLTEFFLRVLNRSGAQKLFWKISTGQFFCASMPD